MKYRAECKHYGQGIDANTKKIVHWCNKRDSRCIVAKGADAEYCKLFAFAADRQKSIEAAENYLKGLGFIS